MDFSVEGASLTWGVSGPVGGPNASVRAVARLTFRETHRGNMCGQTFAMPATLILSEVVLYVRLGDIS